LVGCSKIARHDGPRRYGFAISSIWSKPQVRTSPPPGLNIQGGNPQLDTDRTGPVPGWKRPSFLCLAMSQKCQEQTW